MRTLHIRGGPPLITAALLLGVAASGWCDDAPTDAIGREITVYAAIAETGPTDAIGREFTLFVPTPDTGPTDAIGREFTLFVPTPDTGPTDAIGREFTLFIPPPDPPPSDAIGREFTMYVEPYVTPEALLALRLAAGLLKPQDAQAAALLTARLDVSLPLGKVQVPDAAKVLRLALKLDP